MGIFRVLSQIVIMAAVISAAGCRCAENLFCADEAKITRFFSWAAPQNEIQAQKFAQAGVTDIIVGNRKHHITCKKKDQWRNALHRDAMITLPCASLPAKSRVGARHGVASAVNSITQGGDHPDRNSLSAGGRRHPLCRGCTF